MLQSFGTYHSKHMDQVEELAESIMCVTFMNMLSTELMEATDKDVALKKVRDAMKASGFEIRQEKGLWHYLLDAKAEIVKLIAAAWKKDIAAIKAILTKEVSKQDVLDFVLKLDLLAFHVLTTPIHYIDAVTGWDLHANIVNKAKEGNKAVVKTFKDAFKFIHAKIARMNIEDERKRNIEKELDDVENILAPIMDY